MANNNNKMPNFPKINKQNFKDEALKWHRFGFTVIPVIPSEKRPFDPWSYWENDKQTEDRIIAHWTQYPEHELGAITNDSLLVLDADSPEAIKAIEALEKSFDIDCKLVVKTSKGEHHYYKLSKDIFAKQDSHSTEQHPGRIDVRTGRSLIILPPSGPRRIKINNIDDVSQLSAASQDLIDAVFQHNGRKVPRPPTKKDTQEEEPSKLNNHTQAEIKAYLAHIDPDCGYGDWCNIGMALHHEFNGKEIGLDIFDEWSSKGSKYEDQVSLEKKWQSFANYDGTPITIGTLLKLAIESGADLQEIQNKYSFEECETKTINPRKEPTVIKATENIDSGINPLHKYALNGQSKQLRSQMQDDAFVLDGIALLGQMTLIYSPPNTGKTLLVLRLLMEAIESKSIQPEKVIYINADDNFKGLTTKLELAEKHGFMMLCPGHNEFKASKLSSIIIEMTQNDQARGVIVILDTTKKFTDPMSKNDARHFWTAMRNFIAKGGTVIALAHANKNLSADGKPIYAGTSDSLDDTDCAYTLRVIDTNPTQQTKTVEFENIKSRGDVVNQAAYQYSTRPKISYEELIDSVERVDDGVALLLQDDHLKQDLAIIDAVKKHIREGINKKQELIKATAATTDSSKRAVKNIIEARTGDDCLTCDWNFKLGERGAKLFFLLVPPIDAEIVPKTENLEF